MLNENQVRLIIHTRVRVSLPFKDSFVQLNEWTTTMMIQRNVLESFLSSMSGLMFVITHNRSKYTYALGEMISNYFNK